MKAEAVRFVIDAGNSLVKIAAYRGDEWIFFDQKEHLSDDFLTQCTASCSVRGKAKAIFISTRKHEVQVIEQLSRFFDLLPLTHRTPVPVCNLYETPDTLGLDRLASIVGASALFEKSNVLVIDAGSCITYDFIDARKNYHGGGIMPGLQMKLQSLHTFTGNLPLVSLNTAEKLCGRNTEEAILAGTVNVTLLGLDSLIAYFKEQFSDLKTVICGGNTKTVQSSLKNDTFAEPKLVLYGLKQILDFNEDA
ncbi:MAG: type III pantothenate kinase [Bacteroidales bacterium]|nr:type III pantothenate kinase [Bacteroidales bacterium]